jgi:hypothetical protein
MHINDLLSGPAKMELIHPVGGATGCFLTLVGLESKQAREAAKKANRSTTTVFEEAEEDLKVAAACVIGWDAEFEEAFGIYTPERAVEILLMPEAGWMTEQIGAFIRNRTNFFRWNRPQS